MITLTQGEMAVYNRALSGPYFYVETGAAYLRLAGETRVDFLQRQSTNDLRLLSPERALMTVLTSPTARILDVLLLVDEGDAIGMLSLPGRSSAASQFLRSRIFFMDRVTLDDVTGQWTLMALGGKGAHTILESLGAVPQMVSGDAICLPVASGLIRAVRTDSLYLGDTLIVADEHAGPALVDAVRKAGAVELTPDVREVLRIEKGLPMAGAELSEDYTPLEAGLQDMVAPDKGCYTGQEIIARQLTYDKVVQRLVGLAVAGNASPGNALLVDGRQVGVLTSCVVSPRYGPIGLGYVRRPDYEPGTTLQTGANGELGTVTVRRLQFDAE